MQYISEIEATVITNDLIGTTHSYRKLGQPGQFGVVYKVFHSDNTPIAVKHIKVKSEDQLYMVESEVKCHEKCSGRHGIIRLQGECRVVWVEKNMTFSEYLQDEDTDIESEDELEEELIIELNGDPPTSDHHSSVESGSGKDSGSNSSYGSDGKMSGSWPSESTPFISFRQGIINHLRVLDLENDHSKDTSVHIFIFLECVSGNELADFLGRKDKNFPRLLQLKLSLQVAEAVAQIHDEHVVHGDLKPQNIMVPDEYEDLKIFDFGCAIDLRSPAGHRSLGSKMYSSPEQEKEQQVDQQSDIYSLGMIFLDISLQPHSARVNFHITIHCKEEMVTDAMNDLVQSMLSSCAEERPTIADVVEILKSEIELLK